MFKRYLAFTRFPALTLLAGICASTGIGAAAAPAPDADWQQMDAILERIVAPVFPARDFAITDYGAKGDGTTDAHPAIVKAIEACSQAGGGRVVVPSGTYLCQGPVHLMSGVNLHVAVGATLKFGTDPKDYLPVVLTRWEGILVQNYSPLIYARGQTNIAITGSGTIDGSGREGFYQFVKSQSPDREALWKMGAARVPVEKRVFGEGHYLRPGAVEPFECRNVLIEGVTLTNLPFWVVHPIFCSNVTIRGVKVQSTTGNNDGCDPDSCTDVLIEDCYFRSGDDAVAIKSGRDQDGWAVGRPTENVVVRNCTVARGLYGFAIGSEMSGGVRNVFIQDSQVLSARAGLYTKANLDRGGIVENVHARRIQLEHMSEAAVRFESSYHGYRGENHPPIFRNYLIEEVSCKKSDAYGIYADGQAAAPISGVRLRNIEVDEAKVPLWIRHVSDFRFDNVTINGAEQPEIPPATPETEDKLAIRD
jgi:polygalacturonase